MVQETTHQQAVIIMPRKKRTIVDEILPDDQQRSEEHENDISDIVIVLTKVYRVNPNGKRAFSFQTSEPVDEVMIQERCPNGGSFAVFEYNSTGEVINSTTHDIEPRTTTATANSTSAPSDIHVQMLQNQLQFAQQMVLQLLGNRGSESTPVREIVSAIKDMHSISGGNGKDPVDMIIKGMELANKANGNGGTGDWKSELISTAKEAIGPVVQALSARPPQQPQTGEIQMIPANTNTPDAIIRDAIKWLKSKILFGLTPDLAVDWILQNGNDSQYQPILATAVHGTVDNFIAIDTEIGNEPYRTWFTTAIQMIKDSYAEQSANNSDLDGGTGNTANDATDAKPSSAKSKLKKVG
jgi:hypothetical protein